MNGVNPAVLYYDILLVLSALLSGAYLFMWRRHFDVRITLIFALIPVICLGYALRAHSTVQAEALLANKIIYLGACYLQLIILLAIFALCDIRLGWAGRILKALAFAVSTVVFVYVLNPMQTGDFYTHTELENWNGLALLHKEYGWMHTVFQGMVLFYYAVSIGVIVYSLIRKNQISRKILGLLFFPEVLAVVAFFAKGITGLVELTPLTYVTAQVTYLVIVSRISLYDITDTAVDSLVQKGNTGFIAIDYGHHYLGSNDTAKEIFPILKKLTVDLSVRRRKSFADLVTPWLENYREDRDNNTADYAKDDKIYRITVSPLYNGRKEKGYQLTITDNTKDQQYIHFIKSYNDRLNADVVAATEHIRQMHDNLILSMATMVESRDNTTGGHIRRTSEGVRLLIEQMKQDPELGLSEAFCRNIIKAAPMHDLGKIAVDDAVLRKPGRYTPEEYDKMKTHAAEGARIVHEILKETDDIDFHLIAENVAHYHHERWDGSGYPDGLRGEEIPFEARIMAVADVYDALVSRRPYKEPFTFEQADRIILEGMGSQFDPALRRYYEAARPALEAFYSAE